MAARKTTPTLTDAELRLMRVLWERGACTAQQVLDELPSDLGLAYSTVRTTLRILEQKGYARHIQQGRAFIYEPLIGPETARRAAIHYMVSRFFDGSPADLVLSVLRTEDVDPATIEEVKRLLAEDEQ